MTVLVFPGNNEEVLNAVIDQLQAQLEKPDKRKDVSRRQYRKKGEGVAFPYGKPTPAELARIEELGKLNDDWKRYAGMRSRMGLYRLAARYRRKGMFMTAALVQSEARLIPRKL